MRLDQYLVWRGLAESRTRAQALIKAGLVQWQGQRLTRNAEEIPDDAEVVVLGQEHPWVSRSGQKLAYALQHFGLSPHDRICLDIGASTGGFTDVLLHHGARSVYAVDVGHSQLAAKLLTDERVINLEKVNSRALSVAEVPIPPTAIVADVSFISLKLALPAALGLATQGAWCVALIKPQFEVGRANIGKGGIVKDAALYPALLAEMANWFTELGWQPLGHTPSPITGADGNHEFLMAAQKG